MRKYEVERESTYLLFTTGYLPMSYTAHTTAYLLIISATVVHSKHVPICLFYHVLRTYLDIHTLTT